MLGYDLLALCTDGPEEKLRETRYSQPAIFVTNVALAMAAGPALAPVVSAGHSFGEYCSLTLAGALDVRDGAGASSTNAASRCNRAANLARGAMSAVLGLDDAAAARRRRAGVARGAGRVQLANFNQPGQIVISGDEAAVRVAGELALAAGAKRVIPLNVSGAWHSALMEPARERVRQTHRRCAGDVAVVHRDLQRRREALHRVETDPPT
jgi:[acyl-carrier-protein] S-malonyltransferase